MIDSTAIIYLTHLELADKLSLYFSVVYVPREVVREVNQKHRFRYKMKKLCATGIFSKCLTADQNNVDQLLLSKLHRGEAEALVQAQEKEAVFFIGDEKKARGFAERFGKKPVGTVRLLARLHREGHATETETLVKKLRRDLRCRITDDQVRKAIALADEPI